MNGQRGSRSGRRLTRTPWWSVPFRMMRRWIVVAAMDFGWSTGSRRSRLCPTGGTGEAAVRGRPRAREREQVRARVHAVPEELRARPGRRHAPEPRRLCRARGTVRGRRQCRFDDSANEWTSSGDSRAKFARDCADAVAKKLASSCRRTGRRHDPEGRRPQRRASTPHYALDAALSRRPITASAPGFPPFTTTIKGEVGKEVVVEIPRFGGAATPGVAVAAAMSSCGAGARRGRVILALGLGVGGVLGLAASEPRPPRARGLQRRGREVVRERGSDGTLMRPEGSWRFVMLGPARSDRVRRDWWRARGGRHRRVRHRAARGRHGRADDELEHARTRPRPLLSGSDSEPVQERPRSRRRS